MLKVSATQESQGVEATKQELYKLNQEREEVETKVPCFYWLSDMILEVVLVGRLFVYSEISF